MKKLVLVILTVVTAGYVQKKLKEQQAEKDLWSEATDSKAV